MGAALWCSDCEVSKMQDSSVKLVACTLPKDAKRTILSGTKIQKHHNIGGQLCDYLVMREQKKSKRLAVVELKSKPSHPKNAVAQLQAGADLVCNEPRDSLTAILVHKRGINANDFRLLRNAHVTCNGARVPIRIMRSGETFDEAA